MIIISDTTPIISLLKIEKLSLLEQLFGEVVIPQAVYDELVQNILFDNEAQIVRHCPFIKTQPIQNELAVRALSKGANLDLGESQAIVLFEDLKADILLVDDRKARLVAQNMGIKIAGTLGILIEAKRLGLISKLKSCLDGLMAHNIRISEKLYNDLIKIDEGIL